MPAHFFVQSHMSNTKFINIVFPSSYSNLMELYRVLFEYLEGEAAPESSPSSAFPL